MLAEQARNLRFHPQHGIEKVYKLMLIIPALREQESQEFKVILDYITSTRPA